MMFVLLFVTVMWTHCGTPQAEADCPPVAATPVPAPAPAPVLPAPVKSGAPQHLLAYCVWEETTHQYEIRHTPASGLPAGTEWPIAEGICNQHLLSPTSVPSSIPTVPAAPSIGTPVASPTAVPTTPAAESTPVPPVELPPTDTPEETPEETPDLPPVQIPL